jgi:hypothetical protein
MQYHEAELRARWTTDALWVTMESRRKTWPWT